MKLSIGIIGCGGIAKYHIEGYRQNGITIAALSDTSPQALHTAAQSASSAQCFDSFTELLDSGTVNAVSICTPPVSHREIATEALRRGIHVLCEKPLAHNMADATAIAEAAAAAASAAAKPALFMVGFRHRFVPAVVRMKAIIASGQIGEPVLINNTFCGPAFDMKNRWFSRREVSGGGTLMDTSIHSVDLFRFLAGEVAAQHALTNTWLGGVEVEDSSVLALKARCGTLGSLSASWVAGQGVATIEVIGQQGRLFFSYHTPQTLLLKTAQAAEAETINVPVSLGFAEEIEAFAKAVTSGAPSPCSAAEGLRALEIIQACYGG